jgi:hypothetical protein
MCAVERGGGYKIQICKGNYISSLLVPSLNFNFTFHPTHRFPKHYCQTQREFVLNLKKKILKISKLF